jgi:hypothetical protein
MLADFAIRVVGAVFCCYGRLRYSLKVGACLLASETPGTLTLSPFQTAGHARPLACVLWRGRVVEADL